jgi:hypothetical protein
MPEHQLVEPRHGLAIDRIEREPEVRRRLDRRPHRVGATAVALRLLRPRLFGRILFLAPVLWIPRARGLLGAEQPFLHVVVRVEKSASTPSMSKPMRRLMRRRPCGSYVSILSESTSCDDAALIVSVRRMRRFQPDHWQLGQA